MANDADGDDSSSIITPACSDGVAAFAHRPSPIIELARRMQQVAGKIRPLRVLAGTAAVSSALIAYRYLERRNKRVSAHHSLGNSIYQSITWDALQVISSFARKRHDEDCSHFEQVQRDFLRNQLDKNKETSYGKDFDFDNILKQEDIVTAFRTSQPVTRYDHYVSYIDRICHDEPNVMNASGERILAATSGTSGRRALIPSTSATGSVFFSRGILVIFDVLYEKMPSLFQELQRSCKLAFASSYEYTPSGKLKIGANSSGPNDRGFKRLLPLYSTPIVEAYQMSHDEIAAMYIHALFALGDRNLGMLEGNFVTLPFRLCELIQTTGLALAQDIEAGTLSPEICSRIGDEAKVEAIEKAMGGPNPERAQEIREALEGGQQGLVHRLWPHLKMVLSTASGAVFQPYAKKMQQRGVLDCSDGVIPIFSTVYAASEGLIGIALDPQPNGQSLFCLVPRALFYEFLPMDRENNDDLSTVLANELEPDKDYEMVITNLSGLYRYRLGDVVRFKGYYMNKTPLVEFQYRIGQLLNLRGEKTSEPQLAAAIKAVDDELRKSGSGVVEYTSIQNDEGSSFRYTLLLEVDATLNVSLKQLQISMDEALCSSNPVYATWRKKGAIQSCEVRLVPKGSFEKLRALRITEGTSPQQLKVSRVLRRKEHIDLLLKMHRADA